MCQTPAAGDPNPFPFWHLYGNLYPHETVTFTYTVTVRKPIPAGTNGVLNNLMGSTGRSIPVNCAKGSPICTENPRGKGNLRVAKTNDAGVGTSPGSDVNYEIEFDNTCEHPDYTDKSCTGPVVINYTDNLSDVEDDAIVDYDSVEVYKVTDEAGTETEEPSSDLVVSAVENEDGTHSLHIVAENDGTMLCTEDLWAVPIETNEICQLSKYRIKYIITI
jgi:FlaG/FlaF family flagellin (archaellin)